MSTYHKSGTMTCPRCGSTLERALELDTTDIDQSTSMRIPTDCPECDAPLAIILESALSDSFGFDVWVEDRREKKA